MTESVSGTTAMERGHASPLVERFSLLASLPRVNVVSGPTPVEAMQATSRRLGRDVWVKREDRTSPIYGGNKVRKLAYLLGDAAARRADTLITAGALGSHHVLATATHGARFGFRVHACLSPQPFTDHVEANLRADLAAGAHLHRIPHVALAPPMMAALALAERRHGRVPYTIPHGGSSPVGTIGYVEVGVELARQMDARILPEPDVVYVAMGSAATAVGLAIGLAASGLHVPIRAVRVTSRIVANRARVRHLVDDTVHLLSRFDPRFPRIESIAASLVQIVDANTGGYGAVSDATRRATDLAREDAIALDPTYTAPTIARLVDDSVRGEVGRALYVHTLSSADLAPVLATAPPAPTWARAFAQKTR